MVKTVDKMSLDLWIIMKRLFNDDGSVTRRCAVQRQSLLY